MKLRRSLRTAAASLLFGCAVRAGDAAPLPKGHVVFAAHFDAADALAAWGGAGRLEAGALAVESAGSGANAVIALPAQALRGHTLLCAARVKAENVSAKPRPWNGIKFMLIIEGPEGKEWPQAEIPVGSFHWRRAAFNARIPADVKTLTLLLGLEAVTGKVWFDDVSIVIAKPPAATAPAPAPGPAFKGHALPRLRGAMISPDIDAAGLQVLGKDWNANLIRWQLIRYIGAGKRAPLEEFDPWLEGELAKLDAALPHCRRCGLLVVLDLHSPPGGKATASGYIGSDDRLFTDRASQDKFVDAWRRMAARYKGCGAIWGFDLANEPVETLVEEGCDDWHALAERAAKAVRAVDPERLLIVEPPDWGGPNGFRDFQPIDVPRVVYSVHMYAPTAFTHQTIHGNEGGRTYPGAIGGTHWDKARLEAVLAPVVEFQRRYNAHIYVGEFSAIRWAPAGSACRWLADVISIFEAQGWDWSYHAFREWDGWSVEHSPDRNDRAPAAAPTDRQQLLMKWFARNEKPAR